MRFLLLSTGIFSACTPQNTLHGKTDTPPVGDTYYAYYATGTDTADTAVPPTECVPKSFPLHDIDPGICQAEEVKTPSWELVELFGDTTLGNNLATVAIGHLEDTNGDGQLNDDDEANVVAAPYATAIKAYHADGSLLWSVNAGGAAEQTTPAIGDLNGDGTGDVFVFSLYSSVALDGRDGSKLWTGPGPGSTKAYCGAVEIADLDGDGNPEAIMGRMILNGQDGTLIGEGKHGYGSTLSGEAPNSVVADINLDGEQEVIVGNAAYEMDGSDLWSTGGQDGFPAVGNFDSDPEGEVVVAHSGQLEMLDDDGTTLWTVSVGTMGSYLGPPAIADFNGDGMPEIAVPTGNGVAMFDGEGNKLWGAAGTASGMWDGVSAYDLDGDGAWEVLDNGAAGLTIYDGTAGTLLAEYKESGGGYSCGQNPSIADVDNDGSVDIGYGIYSTGFRVVSDKDAMFSSGSGVWNEHSYNITNISPDGTVPPSPIPNWEAGFNSFRAGPDIGSLTPQHNFLGIVDDVCASTCDGTGKLYVSYALGNDTAKDEDTDVTVWFWGKTDGPDVFLGKTEWTSTIPANSMADSVVQVFDSFPTPLYDVRMVIDPDDQVAECVEDDNEWSYGFPVCP